jgi:hypothetical protein
MLLLLVLLGLLRVERGEAAWIAPKLRGGERGRRGRGGSGGGVGVAVGSRRLIPPRGGAVRGDAVHF